MHLVESHWFARGIFLFTVAILIETLYNWRLIQQVLWAELV